MVTTPTPGASDEDAAMNVTCPNCATVYRVDPAKVPEAGVRARCAICGAVFPVRREGEATRPAPPVPAMAAAPAAIPPKPSEAVAAAPAGEPAVHLPAPPERPVPELRSEPAAEPSPPPPAARPLGAAPVAPAPPGGAPPRPAVLGGPVAPRPAAPAMAPAPPRSPILPRPAGIGGPPAPPAGARRAVNPFLSQDPSQKARRLARALISDMVVYHPAKRRDGLRDGNLKDLFDAEIKKSWEEYVEQVGAEMAETTPHFREALNEILADGRPVF